MDAAAALEFVRSQGIVLMSGKGPAPRLVEAIAGEAIRGSWWGHPASRQIYAVALAVTGSPDVLTCPLLDGKVTLVHRRLWPALVKLAERIGTAKLARVTSEHTAQGSHRRIEEPFPGWVPPAVARDAAALTEEQALALLQPWLSRLEAGVAARPKRRRR